MYFYPNCVVNISDAPVDLEETEYAVVDKSSKENKGINQIYRILLKVASISESRQRRDAQKVISGSYGTVVVKLNNNGGENWLK
jgi:hypothetical protein